MKFGVYVGSVAGTENDLAVGKPDNPNAIHDALNKRTFEKIKNIVQCIVK